MKFYLAARYARMKELRRYRDDLVAAGHTVTARWINGEQGNDLAQSAQEDLTDIERADCVLSFTEPEQAHVPYLARGGRHVEHGYALALGKRCIVVGYLENVFHHLPQVEFYESWPVALKALRQRRRSRRVSERAEATA